MQSCRGLCAESSCHPQIPASHASTRQAIFTPRLFTPRPVQALEVAKLGGRLEPWPAQPAPQVSAALRPLRAPCALQWHYNSCHGDAPHATAEHPILFAWCAACRVHPCECHRCQLHRLRSRILCCQPGNVGSLHSLVRTGSCGATRISSKTRRSASAAPVCHATGELHADASPGRRRLFSRADAPCPASSCSSLCCLLQPSWVRRLRFCQQRLRCVRAGHVPRHCRPAGMQGETPASVRICPCSCQHA